MDQREHQSVQGPVGLVVPKLAFGMSALTWRALVLVAAFAILTLSYASSMRLFLDQQREIAAKKAETVEAQQRIDELSDALERWQDPEYVKAQARDRLGWVVPGETSYVVIGPDGRPVEGSSQISRDRALERNNHLQWWQRAWDTVQTADQPVPTSTLPSTPGVMPQPEPTPTPTPAHKKKR